MTFASDFEKLTGYPPFPWQETLYQRFIGEKPGGIPASCNLPTGLGKTSVVAVWLIALANHPDRIPRRLVYVVNRRTVVDQTTTEVQNYRKALASEPALKGICEALAQLCALPLSDDESSSPLALSTLRGEFADNREWSADPARPAVIVGTVDMIGSRLLFSGYGVGFKGKPLHAGFLGQDVLLVHDEAHLEPAFQRLIESIEKEQSDHEARVLWPKLRVMELSATSRGQRMPFELTNDEKNPPTVIPNPPMEPLHIVWHRMKAKKGIKFEPGTRGQIARRIGDSARRWKSSGNAILVFVRTIDDVNTVHQMLTDKKEGVPVDQVQVLTGTMRGRERDAMVEKTIFKRFLVTAPSDGRTVFLVCTSAGEVGIDISADHMVCDLTTLDSMAQRLGRVNRRGGGAAEIDVFYESDPDPKQKENSFEMARWKTLEMLRRLPECDWIDDRRDGSPLALRNLLHSEDNEKKQHLKEERKAAFAPLPTILPTTDILFDAWALTTIRGKLPGRPSVEPYLHGISVWEPPETHVAWREEIGVITGELLGQYKAEDLKELLEDYPLKPHELLRDNSSRVFDQLKKLKASPDTPVWLVSDDESVEVTTLKELIDAGKEELSFMTVLLPPSAGGLDNGLLTATSTSANDVADELYDEKKRQRRVRLWGNDPRLDYVQKTMRPIRPPIDTKPDTDETEDNSPEARLWYWYELPSSGDGDGSKASKSPIAWQDHTDDVRRNAKRIVDSLPLSEELKQAVEFAARFHDLGKQRVLWQRSIGNPTPTNWLAKSGGSMKPRELGDTYRHEFGSLVDVLDLKQPHFAEFKALRDDMQQLVLHLIAVHHGFGRPHFPSDYVFDPEPKGVNVEHLATEVPQRFARLQRKYGRWGLAYLESILRAADWAASANPTDEGFVEEIV